MTPYFLVSFSHPQSYTVRGNITNERSGKPYTEQYHKTPPKEPLPSKAHSVFCYLLRDASSLASRAYFFSLSFSFSVQICSNWRLLTASLCRFLFNALRDNIGLSYAAKHKDTQSERHQTSLTCNFCPSNRNIESITVT